ncbi:MAG TPA: septum formation initiator family protein [Draconibacterium sp.]|nr:septum formation initiator family protein [Draconibacterium sp.]
MRKDMFKSGVLKKLANKFVIASLIFASWILFFDENSISRQLKDRRQLSDLHQQKEYYQERIAADKIRYEELHKGKAELEKFAREQYYMSKPDEDVFIIVEGD